MRNFAVLIGNAEYWVSRSMATAGFIFRIGSNKEDIAILACKRGQGAADNVGLWCCPCGYLDYNETLKQCCTREIGEETEFLVTPRELQLYRITDDPEDSPRQNVTVIYYSIVPKNWRSEDSYNFGASCEIEKTWWIDVNEIDDFEWAFGHDKIIKEILETRILKEA